MKIYGYKNYDWENDGFYFGIDPKITLVPSVEPQVLVRPGASPTFGVSQIGTMNIVGIFGIRRSINGVLTLAATMVGGSEAAFLYLFRRLASTDAQESPIRAARNDGILVVATGILSIPNYASSGDINVKDANFVIAKPWWEAANYQSGSTGY